MSSSSFSVLTVLWNLVLATGKTVDLVLAAAVDRLAGSLTEMRRSMLGVNVAVDRPPAIDELWPAVVFDPSIYDLLQGDTAAVDNAGRRKSSVLTWHETTILGDVVSGIIVAATISPPLDDD